MTTLQADPGQHVWVRGVTPGTRDVHMARADEQGVIRDKQGRCYGDGPYEIMEIIDE